MLVIPGREVVLNNLSKYKGWADPPFHICNGALWSSPHIAPQLWGHGQGWAAAAAMRAAACGRIKRGEGAYLLKAVLVAIYRSLWM